MNAQDIKLDTVYDSPSYKVWQALTDNEQLRKWYFPLPEFKAEVGFEFQFYGGKEADNQYLHLCKVTQVVPGEKLAYSWRYEGYEGISYVAFELFDIGKVTILKLSHIGIESIKPYNPDFAREEFIAGWNHIVYVSLKEYLDSV